MDFLATVMEVLQVERPEKQKNWHFDGISIMPILRGETPEPRGIGWMYDKPIKSAKNGYAFRYGKWKLVAGGVSCTPDQATFNCSVPQLYNMDLDKEENHDVSGDEPEVFAAINTNFTAWYNTIQDSIENESKCGPDNGGDATFPEQVVPSSKCTFHTGKALLGNDMAKGSVDSQEACCGACMATKGCAGSDFVLASRMKPTWDGKVTGGTCHLKSSDDTKEASGQVQTACQLPQMV
jgi:hypothetical protein